MAPAVRTYEASVIFKPILDLDTAEGGILGNLEAAIKNLGGEVVRSEKVGRKRLAYEMKKFKDGFIVNLLIKMAPENVAPLRKLCKINEDILRITLLTMSDAAIAVAAETNTTVASQNSPPMRDGRSGPGGPGGPGRRDFGNRPPRQPYNSNHQQSGGYQGPAQQQYQQQDAPESATV
jgi:small subunit ribosomal protein S6